MSGSEKRPESGWAKFDENGRPYINPHWEHYCAKCGARVRFVHACGVRQVVDVEATFTYARQMDVECRGEAPPPAQRVSVVK